MHSILRSTAKLTGLLGLSPPAHPVVEQTISEAIENISTYLLMAGGEVVRPVHLAKIFNFHKIDPVITRISIRLRNGK